MASLKDMRNRIASVQATQKITKAMQMVAAAKLRRSQDAAQNARPYAQRMAAVIGNLASGVEGKPGAPELLVGTGREDRHLIVVATSDRGLAGGFNSTIVRAARERINELVAAGKEVRLVVIGRKGRDQLRRQYAGRIVEAFDMSAHKTLTIAAAEPVGQLILTLFREGKADVVTLFYSRFKSVVSQIPTAKRLIPAEVEAGQVAVDLGGGAYDYEPDEEEILHTLLPRNITVQILTALLENQAGFYASQMAAMDNATRNAGDMINRLKIIMNRTRQAKITTELTEIISGAEAL
ncbi:MAG TPA: F0F1 ATP synthase subunit gamma [Caulobacteraceae bacterium]